MIKNPRLLITAILVLPILVLSHVAADAAPSAKFTATDNGDCGSASVSRQNNQSTILSNRSSDISKIEYYLNGVLYGTNTKVYTGDDGINIDCTQLSDGQYQLSGKVYSSSGSIGIITTNSGANYLSFTVKNKAAASTQPVSAKFSATDNGECGSATYSKTFSTIVDSKTGSISKIEYYLNDSLIGTNSKVYTGDDGISFDCSQKADGEYHLSGKIYDSSGASATITTYSKKDFLTFTVKNTGQTTSLSATSSSDNCSSQQTSINTISGRIVTRSTSYISNVDAVVSAVERYYATQPSKLSNYDSLAKSVSDADKKASDSLLALTEKTSIKCQNGKLDLTDFKAAANQLQADMINYKNTAIDLVNALEKL